MKCYYIIKLPGGGEVKLLATVSTILAEGPTKQIYDSLKKEVENYYINKPEYINSKTPLHKAVSEIGLNLTFSTNSQKTLLTTASIDRIDSSKGYTKDNVQWVCYIYNAMKDEFSVKDVEIFLESLFNKYYGNF